MKIHNRRQFMKQSTTALAGAGLASSLPIGSRAAKLFSANEKVTVGVIGCNGMGFSDLTAHLKLPNVACAALCDVDANVLEKRAAQVEEMTGTKPKTYGDYRKLLEQKDIDAVIIGTPDHWHCLTMIDACEAGKDVYVEKPIANSIEECNLMVKAGERYNKIVQVGQWQRSDEHWDQALAYVKSGKLGKIRLVKAWAYMGWMHAIPKKPDLAQPPAGVNYDMWLGPAPDRPFNENRFHFTFRWFWDYAGGLMTDWGVHLIDMVLAGMDAKAPKSVLASGGKFAYPDDAAETPDTLQAVYEFDGFSMLWEHAVGIDLGPYGRDHGVAFIGNDGTLVVDRGKWEVIPEDENGKYKTEAMPIQYRNGPSGLDKHAQNFIESIKTREKPVCSIEVGKLAAMNAQLGNVAYKTGRKVYWDDQKGEFKNDTEANALLKAEYHGKWKLPTV
uniref:Gfo/Idh/MocA family oxidoreductase n=1 Tax=Roseihalotalea indica TaxID=2867963 RepID=A0AA49JFY3_9BACT|nr:Gfo/Idh/MocA family oxidoreductase [Tunicatimonas sp. TK19036]